MSRKPYFVMRNHHVFREWLVVERRTEQLVIIVSQHPSRIQAREAARQLNQEEPNHAPQKNR